MSGGNLLTTATSPTVPRDLRTVDPRKQDFTNQRLEAAAVVARMVARFPDAAALADALGLPA